MNSYSLGISGPWWFFATVIVASFAFSVWYYSSTNPPLPTLRKALHIFLRGIGLSLLLIVLFEPVLSMFRTSEDAPHVMALLDNSQSAAMQDAHIQRKEQIIESINQSKVTSLGDETQIASFDETVRPISSFTTDSLSFKGQRTDIERALRYAADNAESNNTQAVFMVTDGAYNTGANPLYVAEQMGKPMYIVGIGDTTEPKDVSVQTLVTNDVAYIGSVLPVNVTVKASGFEQGSALVTLFDNGAKVSEQTINISKGQQNYSLVFEFKPVQEGNRKLTASIQHLDGELTQKNNSVSEFVQVKGNKRKIVLFAGAPSPDVSFIRSSFESDKSVQVKTYIQKQGAEFYDEAPTSAGIHDAEVIVFVGFPISSTPVNILQLVEQELQRGKPLLFVTSQQVDYNKLRTFDEYLPFTIQTSRPNEFSITADVKQGEVTNPLLRITGTESDISTWNQLPPVFRTETFVKVKPEADVVASMKVNNVTLNDPLIVTRSFQQRKTVAVLGYGIYRWKLLGNGVEQSKGKSELPDVLSSFLLNSAKWLTTNDDQKQVRIKTTKRFYSINERVELIGQVYDAAMTPLDNAIVTVKVSGGTTPREIVMTSVGNGRYTASVDGLSEGDYSFNGTVVVNNKQFGNDNGRFSIGDIAIEYQNLRMNIELLRALAERTGGKFYTVQQASNFLNDVKNHPAFKPRVITQNSEFALWNLAYLLAAAIVCFALEWLLRKRAGMV
ncbi:MAG: VWA domain-containing protein [Candidatus Kapaibacterium sp.]|nr:VWA domain-containing protein [Bacteroidota bacterium]